MADAFATAKDHGWHDIPRTFGDRVALIHSELSEALEEFRDGQAFGAIHYKDCGADPPKPCGVAIELADAIIRIAELCQAESIPLEKALAVKLEYNRTRPYRHGGKTL